MKNLIPLLALTFSVNFSFAIGIEPLPVKVQFQPTYSEKDYVLSFCHQYAPEYVSLIQSSYSSPNSWTRSVNGVVQANSFNAQNREHFIDEFESIIHTTSPPRPPFPPSGPPSGLNFSR